MSGLLGAVIARTRRAKPRAVVGRVEAVGIDDYDMNVGSQAQSLAQVPVAGQEQVIVGENAVLLQLSGRDTHVLGSSPWGCGGAGPPVVTL